jgi:hypothetical protein
LVQRPILIPICSDLLQIIVTLPFRDENCGRDLLARQRANAGQCDREFAAFLFEPVDDVGLCQGQFEFEIEAWRASGDSAVALRQQRPTCLNRIGQCPGELSA